eukprot:Hpha_TRINITY_DN23933_c0_g1::TRINITY_DN23933_c0_g1_i1::g.137723::m.137723
MGPLAAAAKPCLKVALARRAATAAALRRLNERRIVMVTTAKQQLNPSRLMFCERPLTKRQHDRRARAEAALGALRRQQIALSRELLLHSQELSDLIRLRTRRRRQQYCFMLRGLFLFLLRRIVLSVLLLRRNQIVPRGQPRLIAAFGRALRRELSLRKPGLASLEPAADGARARANVWIRAHVESVIAAARAAQQLQEAIPSPPASPRVAADTSTHFR